MITSNGRKLLVFPKIKHGLKSKAQKMGVPKRDPHVPRVKRDILILGSGRCGTTTLAKMLQKVKVDVQHEKVGKRGTSSLYFTVDSDWYPMWPWYKDRVHYGELRSDFEFKHVIQVVRHPLKTIPSMGAIFPSLNYEFFEDNGIIPPGIRSQLIRCMHAYFNLNRLAEEQAEYRFRIEDLKSEWKTLMRVLELGESTYMPDMMVKNRATGFRKREPLAWEDLINADAPMAMRIALMAKRYGYKDAQI